MEHRKYEARVEEALTIKRRSRRDQVRLMCLLVEARDDQRLNQFIADIGLTLAGATNYIAAYAKFADMGLVPEQVIDADAVAISEVVYEMWESTFDPTADGRFGYGRVDNEGIEAVAAEMGLKGVTKAKDIAKNPRSMTAAILGDQRAGLAAVDAVLTLAQRDSLIASALRLGTPTHRSLKRELSPVETLREILHGLDHAVDRLTDFEVPEGAEDFVFTHIFGVQQRLTDTCTVMEGRRDLRAL